MIELMVVMAIILLISSVAVSRLGKMPSFASQEKTVLEIERFFAQASRVAAIRGKSLFVDYHPQERYFQLNDSAVNDFSGNRDYLAAQTYRYELPEGMTLPFEEITSFTCHPSGIVSGPDIRLLADERVMVLKFSPLTGQILRRTEEHP